MLTFGTIKITYPNIGKCPVLVNGRDQQTIAGLLDELNNGLFGLIDTDSTLSADIIELDGKLPENVIGTCQIRLESPDTLVIENGTPETELTYYYLFKRLLEGWPAFSETLYNESFSKPVREFIAKKIKAFISVKQMGSLDESNAASN